MRVLKSKLVSASVALGLLAGTSAAFADGHEAEETTFNMDEITCWDLGTVEEELAGYTMMMLYGYFAGINGTAEHDGAAIEGKLIAVGAVCEENPDMTAIEAFKVASQ